MIASSFDRGAMGASSSSRRDGRELARASEQCGMEVPRGCARGGRGGWIEARSRMSVHGPMNGVGGGGRHVALTFAIIVCVVVEVVSFVSVVVFVHIYFFSDVSRTMSRLCP